MQALDFGRTHLLFDDAPFDDTPRMTKEKVMRDLKDSSPAHAPAPPRFRLEGKKRGAAFGAPRSAALADFDVQRGHGEEGSLRKVLLGKVHGPGCVVL